MNRKQPKRFAPGMSPQEIVESVRKFDGIEVVVVGDLFLDEYIEGEMFEISKEGPIPVIRVESKTQTPGAAGNLASSIRNLGARVRVVGVVGEDANGEVLRLQLEKKGIRTGGVIVESGMRTFTYTKVRARVENTPSRELFRMDILPGGPPDERTVEAAIARVRREARTADAIIVLDQIHHLITKRLLDAVPGIARKGGALLHGSSRDHIGDFHDFDLITPNDREASCAVGPRARRIEEIGGTLKARGRHRKVLLTLGAEGMAAFPERGAAERMPSLATEVVDVTGAGDALSSVAVLGNVLGWDIGTLAWTASHAAAIAIAHVGTHHVSRGELVDRIQMAP